MKEPNFTQGFINNLIHSAIFFRKRLDELPQRLPSKFKTIEDAVGLFTKALEYEGHHAMQQPLSDYSEPLLCITDLDTSRPGLVTKYNPDTFHATVSYLDGTEVFTPNVFTLKLFASPLPFQRHIDALSSCNPSEHLKDVLCIGQLSKKLTVVKLKEMCKENKLKVSGLKAELIDRLSEKCILPNITIYHGPPGTGKTFTTLNRLKSMLQSLPESYRFLVCAPSNVGVINMYTRFRDMGYTASLVMRDEKIPDGVTISDAERESWEHVNKARVVFSTISSRSGSTLRKLNFQVVIVDEAAQCQEAWAWGLLRPETIHIILAGDPNQLPAQVSNNGVKLNFGRSLMERLMDIGYSSTLLDTQRRMHNDIVHFPNKAFYNNKLFTEHSSSFDITPYQVLALDSPETKKGTSFCNHNEAKVVVHLVNKLKSYISDIVVITPYKAQVELLKSLDKSLIIHTVDSFQGKEADAVILSTVRSGKRIGFWQDSRRLNVALTRAKHVLRIVGSVSTWQKSDTTMKALADDASERNNIKHLSCFYLLKLGIHIPVQQAIQFSQNFPWKISKITPHALEPSKSDEKLEYVLSKAIIKLTHGCILKNASSFNQYIIDDIIVDWGVVIHEPTLELQLAFYTARYKGSNEQISAKIKSQIDKLGPEWNESCIYTPCPTRLQSLPFKGKRPPPPLPVVVRDRMRERLQAQNLVSSFRK